MGRYLERVEGIARLTSSYTHLIMDLPVGASPGWDTLVRILDADEAFERNHRTYSERGVLRFLIADSDNPSSIRFAIRAARENVRTTRDVLPEEAWEQVNELYLYNEEMAEKSVGRRNRYEFLEQIVSRSQMINGLIISTISRDHGYRFIKLGRMLERSDMTTRMIDVGAAEILVRKTPDPAVDFLLWEYLLRSLSSMSAYRRSVGPQLTANSVIDFMFKEPRLPRSLQFCLAAIRDEIKPLGNNQKTLALLDRNLRKLGRFHAQRKTLEQVHQFIDQFQADLNQLNDTMAVTWFRPGSS
jgi:uncharacterized alpha-E superfamily protein